ncbi:SDR family NAD(P)-dependent oxidoreductase [uncultured Microbacterium sp.]|uniref:SDR family NAD(P)-dependent oxidoreductase n=1 Tax=uncultured Microbacterium sp. TaxID=191216 RepID=UPI0035CBF471
MTHELEGIAVVVTGGGGGLGREYALAAAAASASVVVNDVAPAAAVETVQLIRDAGGHAVAEPGSVAEAPMGERLVDACLAAYGRIDGLVNNAGVLNSGQSTAQEASVVAASLATNVAGVIHCGTAAVRAMRRGTGGTIVNVVSGAMLGLPDLSLYGSTKAAVMGLTYGWALENAGTSVRVNAISPLAWTPMSDLMGLDDSAKGLHPARIAPAVIYLLSSLSAPMNGQIVRFDGVRLGVMQPPRVAAATTADSWDASAIAAAFAGALRAAVAPVGLVANS